MVRYECDNCQRLKGKDEEWILGFAAENIGLKAARREITFLSGWNEDKAVDWLAVHFCSDGCRQTYTSRLFGETPTAAVLAETAEAPVKKRTVRVMPGRKVSTVVRSKKSRPTSRRKNTSRRKSA
jgi:hypothetical protein